MFTVAVVKPSHIFISDNSLAITFDEELECEKPFLVQATIVVTEIDMIFDSYSNAVSPDLLLLCLGNAIEIQFVEDVLPWNEFDQLFGHKYVLTLRNIQDIAGNVMEDYTYESNFAWYVKPMNLFSCGQILILST